MKREENRAPSIEVHRRHHIGGEYVFTPSQLVISSGLGRCRVEMALGGRVWRGTSWPGDIKVMPAGERRVFKHRNDCHFVSVSIDAAASGALPRGDVRPRAIMRDASLRHLLDALICGNDTGSLSRLFQDHVGTAILLRLHELQDAWIEPPKHHLPSYLLARILEYFDAHLAENVTISELAALVSLSPAHFSTLFRNTTGIPPHQYRNRLRLERARALLESGSSPCATALAVGFYDQSHLARHFRRVYGVTPMAFVARRENRQVRDG
jgi:AraC family transcriptional regulator